MAAHAHHDNGDDDDGPEFPWYSRPIQRQRWGEPQPRPHANPGDSFFDLFYVAAAYNLGTLIRSEISARGVLYFVGSFWPIMLIWTYKMMWDSRYFIGKDDMLHRCYELGILVALGTAVLHIRPVSIMAYSSDNIDMFYFCLAIAIAHVLSIGRIVEVFFNVDGEQAAKLAARRDVMWTGVPLLFYVPAVVVAWIQFHSSTHDPYALTDDDYHGDSDAKNESSYGDSNAKNESSYGYVDHDNVTDTEHLRFLAAAGGEVSAAYNAEKAYDIPIYLLLAGSFSTVITSFLMVTYFLPGGGRHKEVSIPMNINFVIHRFGEWTMLMLGESVLSLLVVDVSETSQYYKTLFSGIVSITLLEYLHFRSQPHLPEDHAMRRSKEAGITFHYLMTFYSMALVALGTSYKMLLYEVNKEKTYSTVAADDTEHRRSLFPAGLSRLLAAGAEGSASEYDPNRRQNVAHWFCISMALVWFCSDAMILVHRGIKDNLSRCRLQTSGKLIATGLVLSRVGLIAWMGTLSQYVTEPEKLAFIGFVGIVLQVVLRFGGSIAFDANDTDNILHGFAEESSDGFKTWPNTTQPQTAAAAKSSDFIMEKIEE